MKHSTIGRRVAPHTLLGKLLLPVGLCITGVVCLAGWLLTARWEATIWESTQEKVVSTTEGLKQSLESTNAVMLQQLQGAMQVLFAEGAALGTPALGSPVEVGGASVPNLVLGEHAQANNFALVDRLHTLVGGTATLFVKRDPDFVRVSTNVTKPDGTRAIGTVLDPHGQASAALRQGQAFYGATQILGQPYLTAYEPMRDAHGAIIGVWYVGYPIAVLTQLGEAIARMRILDHGFVALLDPQGAVSFRSAHISAEDAGTVLQREGAGNGWKIHQELYTPWGYTIVTAFPVSDVTHAIRSVRLSIAVCGLLTIGLLVVVIAVVAVRSMTRPLHAALEITNQIVAGDMTATVHVTSQDEIGHLLQAMQTMRTTLRQMVGAIQLSATNVSTAAREIVQGNSDLSQRTQAQAAALEETASSMEEMTSTVQHNADHARQAHHLAASARAQAEQGGEIVSKAMAAMAAITHSSQQIADIIGVIDGLAFQTNLLALNAAVEAARAGDQGRGFAVVAAEVRQLAQRSAEAAKDIKTLISTSVAKVEGGTQLVNETGQALTAIVSAVKHVSDMVAEIAAASQEQSAGIEQVTKAVMQMDEMTQQNAALVEEAAAASEAVETQAQHLQQLMAFFQLDARATPQEEGMVVTREVGGARRQRAGRQAMTALPRDARTRTGAMASCTAQGTPMDFDQAIDAHIKWKTRLRMCIAGTGEKLERVTVAKDDACALGQWLYGNGTQYKNLTSYHTVKTAHAAFHHRAADVLSKVETGDAEGAQAMLNGTFAQTSNQVVTALRQMKHAVLVGPEHGRQPGMRAKDADYDWVEFGPSGLSWSPERTPQTSPRQTLLVKS